jgi:hypothetical protein
LNSAPSDQRNALLHCLSPSLSEELHRFPLLALDLKNAELMQDELLRIHYSWMAPFLRSLPENEIKLFLSALNVQQIKGLKQLLLLSNALPTPSIIGKAYLKKTLFEAITEDDLIPIVCLPDHPLNCLLDLSLEELYSLIELLSMHDLSIEIRHIIETSKLKEIYSLLTKAQTTFLKTLLHKKEPVSFKKMGLVVWDRDREDLRAMLLQRGINRIAKSLYGCNSSLLWHVAHHLDVEKGQLLIKLCAALDHPRASALLVEQVLELVSSLKNSHSG